jgi:tetratricopeptide (TPR) repeat protein
MKHYLKFATIILLSFLSLSGAAYASDAQETFFQANQAYKNGNYGEALRFYSELTGKGQTSPHICYNLGNTYFRLGDTGSAILNYERARIFMPRDADLNFNLGYVRDRIRDAIEPPALPFGTIFFWLDSVSPNEIFIIFSIINFLFFAMLILRMFLKKEWTFILFIIILVAWLGAGVSFSVKYYQVASDDRAVILAGEASVLAGPDPKDTELFQLHAGAIVKTEKKEGSWSLIKIPGDKRGWIQDSSIGMIRS